MYLRRTVRKMSNREILFRGKRVANGKWVKGFAFEQHSPTEKEQWYIRSYETDYNVDPNTVGQYTGKEDKNGVKIFKDDIIKTKYGRLCQVVWFYSNAYNGWDLRPIGDVIHTRCPDEYDLWVSENLEVVGNIYDNPELIGIMG